MAGERSRYGLVVSALGAIVLAVSVFLPWYGVSLTASGVSYVEQIGGEFAARFGNGTLQSDVSGLHGALGGLAGAQVTALSAHQTLHDVSIVLLALAGLALLDALLALARPAGATRAGAGASVVLLGCLATLFVLYRMLAPPTPAGAFLELSLREGAWLSLLGAMAMALGGLWPRVVVATGTSETQVIGAWSGLSGWTPGA